MCKCASAEERMTKKKNGCPMRPYGHCLKQQLTHANTCASHILHTNRDGMCTVAMHREGKIRWREMQMAIMRLEWKMAQFSSLPLLIPPQCRYVCIASTLSPLLLTVPVEHVQFACSLVSSSLPLFLLICHNHPQTNSWRQP